MIQLQHPPHSAKHQGGEFLFADLIFVLIEKLFDHEWNTYFNKECLSFSKLYLQLHIEIWKLQHDFSLGHAPPQLSYMSHVYKLLCLQIFIFSEVALNYLNSKQVSFIKTCDYLHLCILLAFIQSSMFSYLSTEAKSYHSPIQRKISNQVHRTHA